MANQEKAFEKKLNNYKKDLEKLHSIMCKKVTDEDDNNIRKRIDFIQKEAQRLKDINQELQNQINNEEDETSILLEGDIKSLGKNEIIAIYELEKALGDIGGKPSSREKKKEEKKKEEKKKEEKGGDFYYTSTKYNENTDESSAAAEERREEEEENYEEEKKEERRESFDNMSAKYERDMKEVFRFMNDKVEAKKYDHTPEKIEIIWSEIIRLKEVNIKLRESIDDREEESLNALKRDFLDLALDEQTCIKKLESALKKKGERKKKEESQATFEDLRDHILDEELWSADDDRSEREEEHYQDNKWKRKYYPNETTSDTENYNKFSKRFQNHRAREAHINGTAWADPRPNIPRETRLEDLLSRTNNKKDHNDFPERYSTQRSRETHFNENAWSNQRPTSHKELSSSMREKLIEDLISGRGIKIFNGNPDEYNVWSSIFWDKVERARPIPFEILSALVACTKGLPQIIAEHHLQQAGTQPGRAVNACREEFNQKYGDKINLARRLKHKLENFPIVSPGDTYKIEELNRLVLSANREKDTNHHLQTLDDIDWLRNLTLKMPINFKNRWKNVLTTARQNRTTPTFNDFAESLGNYVLDINTPTWCDLDAPARQRNNERTQYSEKNIHRRAEKDYYCALHGQNASHSTPACRFFPNLPSTEKRKLLKQANLCWKCTRRHNGPCGLMKCEICHRNNHITAMHENDFRAHTYTNTYNIIGKRSESADPRPHTAPPSKPPAWTSNHRPQGADARTRGYTYSSRPAHQTQPGRQAGRQVVSQATTTRVHSRQCKLAVAQHGTEAETHP